LPDRLQFLIFTIVPAAGEVLLLPAAGEFFGEVPTSDDSFHATSEEIAFPFDCCKDGPRMFPNSSETVDLFSWFLDVPNLHGGVL
jgi:hypothetical protein